MRVSCIHGAIIFGFQRQCHHDSTERAQLPLSNLRTHSPGIGEEWELHAHLDVVLEHREGSVRTRSGNSESIGEICVSERVKETCQSYRVQPLSPEPGQAVHRSENLKFTLRVLFCRCQESMAGIVRNALGNIPAKVNREKKPPDPHSSSMKYWRSLAITMAISTSSSTR